jgi:hypothetical protein
MFACAEDSQESEEEEEEETEEGLLLGSRIQ